MGEELQPRRTMFWFVQGNVKILMFCRVIWSASTSIVYPFFSLYILALGGTSTEIGLINALGIIAGMILYPVGGYIADKAGRVKLIGYSTFVYTFAHLFFVVANDWRIIALGQFMSQLLLFYMPAMNALEADSLPPGVRGRGFAIMMAVSNIGTAIVEGVATTLSFKIGFQLVFLVLAGFNFINLLILYLYFRVWRPA